MTIIRHTDCAVLNTAMTEAGYEVVAIETYRRPDGVTVASEPSDDDEGWVEVPEASVLRATREGVSIRPLPSRNR